MSKTLGVAKAHDILTWDCPTPSDFDNVVYPKHRLDFNLCADIRAVRYLGFFNIHPENDGTPAPVSPLHDVSLHVCRSPYLPESVRSQMQ